VALPTELEDGFLDHFSWWMSLYPITSIDSAYLIDHCS